MNVGNFVFETLPERFWSSLTFLGEFVEWLFTDYEFGLIQGSSVTIAPIEAMIGSGLVLFAGFTIAKWVLPFL